VCWLENISQERPKIYVGNRMEWERHIVELIADESDTCQQLYRIEYSAFLKLCTILSPQVQVNDEMSGHKNSMGYITMR